MILIIFSINSIPASSPTQVEQRQNESCGQVNAIHYDRRMVAMCPLSLKRLSAAMNLFRSGSSEHFFGSSISLHDNGGMREPHATIHCYCCKFLLILI